MNYQNYIWIFCIKQIETTEMGGLTAFPLAGIAAKPIKGSAVFWYNLKRNGDVDENTCHCACPVVLGHKISKLFLLVYLWSYFKTSSLNCRFQHVV